MSSDQLLRAAEPVVGCTGLVEGQSGVIVVVIRLTSSLSERKKKWNTGTTWAPTLDAFNVVFVLVRFCRGQWVFLLNSVYLIVCTTHFGAIVVDHFGTMPWEFSIVLENKRLPFACLPCGKMWKYLPFACNIVPIYLYRHAPLIGLHLLPIFFWWSLYPWSSPSMVVCCMTRGMVISSMSLSSLNLHVMFFLTLPARASRTYSNVTLVLRSAPLIWLQCRHQSFVW